MNTKEQSVPAIFPRRILSKNGREFVVRFITPEDENLMKQLFRDYSDATVRYFHPHPFTPEKAEEVCRHGATWAYPLVVATSEAPGTGAGYGFLSRAHQTDLGIGIADAFQGIGLGKALMRALLELAGRLGRPEVHLCVYKENNRARTLYESMGFVIDGATTDGRQHTMVCRLGSFWKSAVPPWVKEVAVLPYCHADFAWCHSRAWHKKQYVKVISEVLDIMEARADYRWYMDTFHEELLPFIEACPDRLPELAGRISEGRIEVVGATYSNPRSYEIPGEALIRNLLLGRESFLSLFPDADLQTFTIQDVPPGTSQMPQIIKKCGFRYYRFYRPEFALEAEGVPREFHWQGLDGSRVLCSYGWYRGLDTSASLPPEFRDDPEAARRCLIEKHLARVHTWGPVVWLQRGGDDCRPLRTFPEDGEALVDVPAIMKGWNAVEDAKMRFATPTEVFRRIEACPGLPVVRGPLDSVAWSMLHGLLGGHSFHRFYAAVANVLLDLERLLVAWHAASDRLPRGESAASITDAREKPPPIRREDITALWKDMLQCSGHAIMWTFIEDFHPVRERLNRLLAETEAGRCSLLEQLTAAAAGSEPVIEDQSQDAAQIRKRGLLPEARSAFVPPNEPRVRTLAVWNPHSWSFASPLECELVFRKDEKIRGIAVTHPAYGPMAHQIRSLSRWDDGSWRRTVIVFLAEAAPLAVTTLSVVRAEETRASEEARYWDRVLDDEAVPDALSGACCRAELLCDGLGRIALADGKTAVPRGKAAANALTFHAMDDPEGKVFIAPIREEISMEVVRRKLIELGPVYSRLLITSRMSSHTAEQCITIYQHHPVIHFRTRLYSAGGAGEFRVGFPLAEGDALTAGIAFGAEPRTPGSYLYESVERALPGTFQTGSWLDVGHGDACGYTIINSPGCFGYGYRRDAVQHILCKNTQPAFRGWEANASYLREGKGEHVFDYGLYPHSGDWRAGKSWKRALEFHHAPTVHVLPSKPGFDHIRHRPGLNAPLLEVNADNLAVSALLSDRPGSVICRLYEAEGKETAVEIALSGLRGIERAGIVDLRGEPLVEAAASRCTLRGGLVRFRLRPYEITTLKLEATPWRGTR